MPTPTPPVVRSYPRPAPYAPMQQHPRAAAGRRLMHSPPGGPQHGQRHGGTRHPRPRVRFWWARRRTRVWLLVACLVLLAGGTLAASVWADSSTRPPSTSAARSGPPLPLPTVNPAPCALAGPVTIPGCTPTPPAPSTLLPLPLPLSTTPVTCFPGSLQPECLPGTSGSPAPTATGPCSGPDCIPQPVTTPPVTGGGTGSGSGGDGGQAACSIVNPLTWNGCVNNAIASFLAGLVASALNPLLDLLGSTLLSTPDPGSLPQVGVLWTNSWQLMLACYGILVLIAGIVIMAYQTLHTHHGIKEIAPRIGIGFLAGTLSLFLATKAIQLANALALAILGDLDTHSVAASLKAMLEGTPNGGIFVLLFGVVLAALVLALLVVYAIRLVITVMLLAAAPLALMLHALPQTEGIAYWWWRAFGAVLTIQLAQSLTLVTVVRVFF